MPIKKTRNSAKTRPVAYRITEYTEADEAARLLSSALFAASFFMLTVGLFIAGARMGNAWFTGAGALSLLVLGISITSAAFIPSAKREDDESAS